MSQEGKVALVTGGAQGIGRAIVEALLAEGASVVLLDVNQTVGEQAVKELSQKYNGIIAYLQCNVADANQLEESFKETIAKFGRLDIVVNNAGIITEKGDLWENIIDINFTAVVRGTKLGMKYMGKQNGGQGGIVVNIASIVCFRLFPALPVYGATKAAVNHFTRSYGQDIYYQKSGVKVMAINPGLTDTSMERSIGNELVDDPDVKKNWETIGPSIPRQRASSVARGLIKILQVGKSASLWISKLDEDPIEITEQNFSPSLFSEEAQNTTIGSIE